MNVSSSHLIGRLLSPLTRTTREAERLLEVHLDTERTEEVVFGEDYNDVQDDAPGGTRETGYSRAGVGRPRAASHAVAPSAAVVPDRRTVSTDAPASARLTDRHSRAQALAPAVMTLPRPRGREKVAPEAGLGAALSHVDAGRALGRTPGPMLDGDRARTLPEGRRRDDPPLAPASSRPEGHGAGASGLGASPITDGGVSSIWPEVGVDAVTTRGPADGSAASSSVGQVALPVEGTLPIRSRIAAGITVPESGLSAPATPSVSGARVTGLQPGTPGLRQFAGSTAIPSPVEQVPLEVRGQPHAEISVLSVGTKARIQPAMLLGVGPGTHAVSAGSAPAATVPGSPPGTAAPAQSPASDPAAEAFAGWLPIRQAATAPPRHLGTAEASTPSLSEARTTILPPDASRLADRPRHQVPPAPEQSAPASWPDRQRPPVEVTAPPLRPPPGADGRTLFAREAAHIGEAIHPVLSRAADLTEAALDPAADGGWLDDGQDAPPVTPAAPQVNNTFNVTVALGERASAADREGLRDALVAILRDSARRHGLDV